MSSRLPRRVVFGFLGTVLDAVGGFSDKRHAAWRPSVAVAAEESLGITEQVLWYPPTHARLAELVKGDIESLPNSPRVTLHELFLRDPWNFEEVYSALYDFASQYPFDPDSAEYFVHLTTGSHVAQICLFLLTETRHFPGRLVQSGPGREGGAESFSVIDLDLSKYGRLSQRFARKVEGDREVLKAGIKTKNAKFNSLISQIERVARAGKESILLQGPTGAGKSSLARQIFHVKKDHRQLEGEFVEINCATLRGEHATSTLFGHTKGAFTGAATKRNGLLKKAHKGILFLDEIGELGLDEQAMLLRALEERRFLPMGSDEEEESEFLLIAGTNRDLLHGVKEGRFREDLLYRINTWSFTLPPLSQRLEDIEPNIQYELQRFEERSGRRVLFASEAWKEYLEFATTPAATWLGNFRDLNASIARMCTLSEQGRITADIVREEIARLKQSWRDNGCLEESSRVGEGADTDRILTQAGIQPTSVDLFEQAQLASVIQVVRRSNSIAEAGRTLFAVSRKEKDTSNDSDRLRKYLTRFGLDARRLVGSIEEG